VVRATLAVSLACGPAAAAQAPAAAYRAQPQDTVVIVVTDQPALSTTAEIDPNGAITLPLVGRVAVAGMTATELSAELRTRVSEFVRNPVVSVRVVRTPRVFVAGDVLHPGMFALTENPTLLELLVRAGYKGPGEVLIVHATAGAPAVPTAAPPNPSANVERVNLWDLERDLTRGSLAGNLRLKDGDTVFVPRFDPNRIHVSGEVRKPGDYPFTDGTTVRQALTLAGGVTDGASIGRIRILRVVGNTLERLPGELEDALNAGDTISVPHTIEFPVVLADALSTRNRLPLQMRVGDWLVIDPSIALHRIGIDTNAVNDPSPTPTDFTIMGGPDIEARVDTLRVKAQGGGGLDFVYYKIYTNETALDWNGHVSAEIIPVAPVSLLGGISHENTRDRYSTEVDARPRRFVDEGFAGIRIRFGERIETELTGRQWSNAFENPEFFRGVNLQQTLTERIQSATADVNYVLTPTSKLFVEGREARHTYDYLPTRNADETDVMFGVTIKPRDVRDTLEGELRGGYVRYIPTLTPAAEYRGAIGTVHLLARVTEPTQVGVSVGRTIGTSYRYEVPYAIVDDFGGSIRQAVGGPFDVLFEAGYEIYRNEFVLAPIPGDPPVPPTEPTLYYVVDFGVRVPGGGRVGLNIGYWRRDTIYAAQNYNALRAGISISYGAFQRTTRQLQ